MSIPAIRPELAKFLEALIEDEDLRQWFESFASLDEHERAAQFRAIAARMRAAGEHHELVEATALLAASPVYEALRKTLSELHFAPV